MVPSSLIETLQTHMVTRTHDRGLEVEYSLKG